ncbi:winged helix-turn-helix domain-containing protein [Rhodococcus sp. 15-649-2-2]|nr:winged helix-turn-helix domain-containing protein [Rhodococcus sp. 15-649-2-2]
MMDLDTRGESSVVDRLRQRGALERLGERRRYREIVAASRSGVSHKIISELLGTMSQATVTRALQRCSVDPDVVRETPAEVIDRCVAGEITRAEMMAALLNWRYTFGVVPTVGGVATDAYITGDWDQIEDAYYNDLIYQDEFDRLSDRQLKLTDGSNVQQ